MSKAKSGADMYPPASKPAPAARKASGPAGNAKFYNGPTVSAKAEDVKGKAKEVAKVTTAEAKRQAHKASAVVRRHPWSFISILTTLPFLVTISLLSTVICPPPTAPPSTFSRLVRTPLGLNEPPHSELYQAFCYPSNWYHQTVLQPYIYPIIEDTQTKITSHPVYKGTVEPSLQAAQRTAQQVWKGPIQPVVDRITRGARRFHLTFIQPHIPYLKARAHALTAPYTARLTAIYQTYIAPYISTARIYAKSASDNAIKGYKYVSTHPITGHTGRYAKIGQQKAYQGYLWSRPHAIRAGQESKRVAKEVLGPRVIRGIEVAGGHVSRGWVVAKAHIIHLYNAHLEPHVGPYVAKAQTALGPYSATFHKQIYKPYLAPVVEAILPSTIFSQKPKTFWSMIADILPSANVMENKGKLAASYGKGTESIKKTASAATRSASSASASASTKAAQQFDKAEMERVREDLKRKIDKQGKEGLETVKSELLATYQTILTEPSRFPALIDHTKHELEREKEYTLKGLDKLYTSSTSLNRDQVKQSSEMADERVSKKLKTIKDRVEKTGKQYEDEGKPVVRNAFEKLDALLGKEYILLQDQMARLDGVTQKDWQKFHSLKKASDGWKDKYMALHSGEAKDRALLDPSANIPRAVNNLKVELDDNFIGFRDQVNTLKRIAYDRIEAREAVGSETAKTTGSRVSILPIAEAGAAGAGAAQIIGKGKEQILDAFSRASAAAAKETSTGITDHIKSAYDAASSGVHDATRSAVSAVGATPSPESPREHAESILNLAQENVQSVYSAAGDAVHQATRSAMSAVGATPSPESPAEHAESLLAAASDSAESMASVASDAIHHATRSIQSAVGATPSPENVQEHLKSIGDVAARGYASAAEAVGGGPVASSLSSISSVASEAVHQATRSAMSAVGATPSPESAQEHLESIANVVAQGYAAVGDKVHEATRSGLKAVGITPTPESIPEHATSIVVEASSFASDAAGSISSYASVASASASSLVNDAAASASYAAADVSASASSVASAVSQAFHDATRSALLAVGATPSPETPGEYAVSLASEASASASSLASAAAEAVHQATRSAGRAVGATPSPETPGEHLYSVVDAASSGASSVYDAAASVAAQAGGQAALLATSIQSALGLVPSPTPIASSASSYLVSLAAAGTDAGADLLSAGSSLLASLQAEASTTLHSATRAAGKAVGATPSPETPGEYLEDLQERLNEAREKAEELVKRYAGSVGSGVAEATASVKSAIGVKDEL
ncbi:hypothetical protein BCR39DRAFT_587128 [Naematelia encephala]|uniref:Uncharacterized protein n=1 Tax=Naematelia encephala TaxID=71784 RepID=A0A1Y2BDK1_9TREE|nr:hypothetical protein BCR39DRAFT_587128 [Naematelia encephala]